MDARGAAGAEQGLQAGSTASWLRHRLRMGAGAAAAAVRTARALFGGPLTGTAQALVAGEISPAHAQVLAHGTQDLPAHVAAEAEPVLVEAARRLDPPRLRRVVAHLCWRSLTPRAPRARRNGVISAAGCRWPPPGRAWSRSRGCWRLRPARSCWPPLSRWPARPTPTTPALVVNAGLMPWSSWPAATWKPASCPNRVGCGPSCWSPWTWTACWATPAPRRRGWWGRAAAAGGVPAAGLRQRGHPGPGHPPPDRPGPPRPPRHRPRSPRPPGPPGRPGWPGRPGRLLQTAARRLPPALGGGPTQPLELGRTTRVVSAAQRAALVVRDGGCAVAGCHRPPAWCEAHHLRHWLHGGPTDLANLALVCRAHHRAVHEGGWRLDRDPDGRLTATPPHRKHTAAA